MLGLACLDPGKGQVQNHAGMHKHRALRAQTMRGLPGRTQDKGSLFWSGGQPLPQVLASSPSGLESN